MTDYAVVILTALARTDGRLSAASQLSAQTGLSEPTVAKILKLLARREIVSSVRGAAGGYRLVQAPENLSHGAGHHGNRGTGGADLLRRGEHLYLRAGRRVQP